MKKTSQTDRQQGFSLVELMIALALGLFLIWGVTQSFLTSRQSYRLQEGVGRIQENGRLADEFLGFDIRNAGDYGCANGDDFIMPDAEWRNTGTCAADGNPGINMISTEDFATNEFKYAVYGFNDDDGANAAVTDGTNTINLDRAPKAGSDILVLRLSEDLGVLTVAVGDVVTYPKNLTDISGTAFNINKGLANSMVGNQPVAVSDCATTKIFAFNGAGAGTTNLGINGGSNYCNFAAFRKGASVRKLTTVYYFVAPSLSDPANFSLYRQKGEGVAAEELLEGVDDMQLLFGVDDAGGDGQVDNWVTADNVTEAAWNGWDWIDEDDGDLNTSNGHRDPDAVRAVRYSLLLRTNDKVLTDPQSLTYNGAAVPADGILRQVFTSSVGIRSRVNPD